MFSIYELKDQYIQLLFILVFQYNHFMWLRLDKNQGETSG